MIAVSTRRKDNASGWFTGPVLTQDRVGQLVEERLQRQPRRMPADRVQSVVDRRVPDREQLSLAVLEASAIRTLVASWLAA